MYTQKQINNYISRQNNWIKANNVKEGQTVLILKTVENTTGWNNAWVKSMLPLKIGKIIKIKYDRGISLDTKTTHVYFTYPYNCLLPLPGEPEDYEIKNIVAYDTNESHKCVISKKETASKGEFGYQRDAGNGTSALRKIVTPEIEVSKIITTYYTKGYFPYDLKFRTAFPKVVASTLKGIGLPIIKL